ncbi:MAG: hypothetical protein CUN52_05015 [Phototrophicales bacterium]|jgi:hypothetical protein|nr:MAG: hypothetical protein CUN52_05015 [Phototrophicales bacterium]
MPIIAIDWRLILLFFIIGLLLVSCTGHLLPSDATAILMPPITLTVHLSQAVTATPIGLPTAFPLPSATPPWVLTKEDNIILNTPSPICYEDDITGMVCLGLVQNPHPAAFKDIQVLVELFNHHGALLTSQTTALLQHNLPPRGSAPYHIQFPQSADEYGAVRVSVIKFTPLPQAITPPDYVMADIQNRQADNHYQVTGKLIRGQAPSGGVRMIITLYDAYDHVAGYRVLEIPQLSDADDTSFSLDLTPKIRGTTLRYTIYLEHMP